MMEHNGENLLEGGGGGRTTRSTKMALDIIKIESRQMQRSVSAEIKAYCQLW